MSEPEAPRNFGGLEPRFAALETARVVVLPVPYDRTASYMKGTAGGPQAAIEASRHMELYDDELELEPHVIGIHTASPVSGNDDPPEVMAGKVEKAVAGILAGGRLPAVLGGEHSVAIGAIRACLERHPRLSILQFDAHGDLRDTFEGSPYNHACVMRRFAGDVPTLQVGIRSISREEADFIRQRRLMVVGAQGFIADPAAALALVDRLTEEIYVTFDVDYFDPAIMPATGTPEPGGPGWYPTLAFLREVFRRKTVVGLDINELRPLADDVAPDFLAAKLLYKMIAYRFFEDGGRGAGGAGKP
jgi:agmatinase